jgi:hypothetical protein
VPEADACCLHVFVSRAGMAGAGPYTPQQQPVSHLPPYPGSTAAATAATGHAASSVGSPGRCQSWRSQILEQ